MQINLSAADLNRFSLALSELAVNDGDRIILAVSGGPDSLAMLFLAHAVAADRIIAATIDHRLRSEAADEAAFVNDLCRNLRVPHLTLVPSEPVTGNIQSAARNVRYALLEQAADEHECDVIATAHHGNDQLETMLMRLARGSGLDGLAAIRRRNGRIIRPLLGFSKSELEEICVNAGVEPVRDPSNDNPDFDRVSLRQWLAQSRMPFDIARANRTAHALSDAAEALMWVVNGLAAQRITEENNEIQCDTHHLPRDLQRRLLLACLSRLEPALTPRGDAIDRLITDLNSGKITTIGNIRCQGGELWRFSVAPPRRVIR